MIIDALKTNILGFLQADGSGLSYHNRVSPYSIAQLLWAFSDDDEFMEMLPLAGESGTLSSRFVGTPAQGTVYAKTGTVTGVSALSGYVNRDTKIVFSIIVNQSTRSTTEQQSTIDQIVVLLSQLTGDCNSTSSA